MSKKFKVTGFTRFVLVMVVLAPLAFIGAAYYNGDDGIQKFKELIGLEASKPSQNTGQTTTTTSTSDSESGCDVLQREVDQLKKKIVILEEEKARLQGIVKNRDLEIKNLKGR